MVIGSGMIAKRFSSYADNDRTLVFASGVSNSSSTEEREYKREEELLRQSILEHPEKTLVYFSTCSIYDPSLQQSVYVKHKLKLEQLIQQNAGTSIIYRVSNPVGYTKNKHTVLNYFATHVKEQLPFTVWKYASRNLIDMDDVFALCNQIIEGGECNNSIVNIANPVNYPVTMIIRALEKHFSVKSKYSLADKGNSPLIDTSVIQPLFSKLRIEFNNDYLDNLLKKYFPLS